MSRPVELPEDVTNKAIEMRSQGHSYNTIVEALKEEGATERWVKRITKGVSKVSTVVKEESLMQSVVEKIYNLAKRPQGVKPSEINKVYYEAFGTVYNERKERHELNLSQKEKDNIKKKVTKIGKDRNVTIMFTPEWVQVKHIKQSKKILFDSTQELHELLFNIKEQYRELFQECTDQEANMFVSDVLALNTPRLCPRGVHATFDLITDKLDKISKVVEQKPIRYEEVVFDKEQISEFDVPY